MAETKTTWRATAKVPADITESIAGLYRVLDTRTTTAVALTFDKATAESIASDHNAVGAMREALRAMVEQFEFFGKEGGFHPDQARDRAVLEQARAALAEADGQ